MNLRPAIWFLILLGAGCAVVALFAPLLTDRGSRGGHTIRIIRNLRQIDVAKELWTRDHSTTGSVKVSSQDLVPYMPSRHGTNEFVTPVAGERYVINPMGVEPQAELTLSVGRWPSGAVIQLHGPVLLPNEQGGANRRQPVQSETNRTSPAAASGRSP
jgi:hypothetical protein